MKRSILLPLIFLLAGCPGGNPAPHPRATLVNGEHLCFSTNREDVLNYYTVDTSENGEIRTVMSSASNRIASSYPNNCIDVKWQSNHTYAINYGLNGKKYVHEFFIDSNGKLDLTHQ